jgi:hypothetical protein
VARRGREAHQGRAEEALWHQVKYVELPPGPEPKPLTARHHASDFHDRLTAFLAVNNVHGFVIEDIPPESEVMKFLIEFEQHERMTLEKFKRHAHKLKDLCQRTVKNSHCLELLAAVWGYRTYTALRAAMIGDTVRKKA